MSNTNSAPNLDKFSSDDQLIINLRKQLDRLIEQISDLEECKSEITEEEYSLIRQDTKEQIIDYEATLEKMEKKNESLSSQISVIKTTARDIIAKSFNAAEINQQLSLDDNFKSEFEKLDENYHLKKIDRTEYHNQKMALLRKLLMLGRKLSPEQEVYFKSSVDHDPLNDRLEELQDS